MRPTSRYMLVTYWKFVHPSEGSGINSVLVDILSFEDPAGLLSHILGFKGSKCIFPVRMRHPLCYGKSLSPLLEAGGIVSIVVQHRGCYLMNHHHMAHAGLSSLSLPIGSRRLGQFPAQACLSFITVDLSPRVRGSTQVGPTISAIWVRRELENPSTRRAPKLLEDYQGPACLLLRLFSKPPR